MILVDSSVWIDFYNGTITRETDFLDRALGETPIAIGDLILTEVLQGFRSRADMLRAH
jgi:predicted nucleic acid-binding protein